MRATIKRKNLRRLASLSALGAGAMAVGAGTAEADIVHVVENQMLNWGVPGRPAYGQPGPIQVSLPGGAGFSLFGSIFGGEPPRGNAPQRFLSTRFYNGRSYGVFDRVAPDWLYIKGRGGISLGAVGTAFSKAHFSTFNRFRGRVSSGSATAGPRGVPVGRTWRGVDHDGTRFLGGVGTFNSVFSVGPRGNIGTFVDLAATGFNSKNAYFLFQFPDNGKTLYGWGQLSWIPNTLDLQLDDIAYDTTGATIAAGQTSVPEPSETVPLALSALVLGAAGIRRWRAAKTS